jgi:hypothetical protein
MRGPRPEPIRNVQLNVRESHLTAAGLDDRSVSRSRRCPAPSSLRGGPPTPTSTRRVGVDGRSARLARCGPREPRETRRRARRLEAAISSGSATVPEQAPLHHPNPAVRATLLGLWSRR